MKVRQIIRQIVIRPFLSSRKMMKKKIDRAGLVSFDIFDTLVRRDVLDPMQVHEETALRYAKRHGKCPGDYARLRICAEREARKKAGGREVTLGEIICGINGCSGREREELFWTEQEVESELCCADPSIRRLYQYTRRLGKHIVITSDMYLPEETVKEILKKCGYTGYEKLYLSSSYGETKRSGKLFEHIRNDYPEMRGKMLHIGDSLTSDYLAPRRNGMDSILTDRYENHLRYWKRPETGQWLYPFMNNRAPGLKDQGDASRIGYEVLGPLLLGFCQWLHGKVYEDKVEKLFFLSREGRLLMKAYCTLYAEDRMTKGYLRVSRRALLIPRIPDAKNYDELIDLIKIFLRVPQLGTVGEICLLDMRKYASGLKKLGLDTATDVFEVGEEKKEAVFLLVQGLGRDYFLRQKDLLSRYLKQCDFRGRAGIVDVGWSGTMQRFLTEESRESGTEIQGYYMGVRNVEDESCYSGMRRSGYLFSPGKNGDIDYGIRFTTELFETLFLEPVGSVLSYSPGDDGEVLPVLAQNEFDERMFRFLKAVQDSAMRFLMDVKAEEAASNREMLTPEEVFKGYASLAVRPSMRTLNLFRDFVFEDGSIRHVMVPGKPGIYYLIHPKKLKEEMERSCNKVFFLKKIFVADIPYVKIMRCALDRGILNSSYRRRFFQ